MRSVTVRIACAQLPARPLADAEGALGDVIAGIAAAASQDAQIAVFPECSYPSYVLLGRHPFRHIPGPETALRAVSETARGCGVAVALGIARYDDSGRLRNEAVFIDRHGTEVARYAKIFLWNFDARWFAPGETLPTVDTEFGRIGMMICADGRMPEIARTLARKGAWLLLDPTAWVAFGASYAQMQNPQVQFMMSIRARENSIWIAAADKCGTENGAVHYVGQSMIVAPDGSSVSIAPPDRPALIVADARSHRARPFVVTLSTEERRTLASLTRVGQHRSGPAHRLGILQGPMRGGRDAAIATLRAQSVAAVIDTAADVRTMRSALRRVRGLRVFIVDGERMLAPEPARAAALRWADVLLWTNPPNDRWVRNFARTRALENRVYVIVCARARDPFPACIVDPAGNVCGEAVAGMASAFVAAVETAVARNKTVVPGTNAFTARAPSAFISASGRAR